MAKKFYIPRRWEEERRAIKAVQIAFDVGDEVQYLIKREALDQGINPTDRIRQILGLPVSKKPVRPRLSISLSETDFQILGERFDVEPGDRLALRQMAAERLIAHMRDAKDSS